MLPLVNDFTKSKSNSQKSSSASIKVANDDDIKNNNNYTIYTNKYSFLMLFIVYSKDTRCSDSDGLYNKINNIRLNFGNGFIPLFNILK